MSHGLLHAVQGTGTESVEGGGRTGEHELAEIGALCLITERRGAQRAQQKTVVL